MTDREDFVRLIEPVARHYWGDPNEKLSKRKKGELRFGRQGSKSIILEKGTWYDNEAGQGGGVLDLVMREERIQRRGEAVEWLRDKGFEVPDDRREPTRRREDDGDPGPQANGRGRDERQRFEITATYDYVDEAGALLYQVCRLEPPDAHPGEKTFRQRKPNKRAPGGWEWSVKGVRLVPYRLPDLLAAIRAGEDIWIPEGEKDVDNLIAQGLAATCNPMGAGKWPAEFAGYFAGAKRVILLPDNDDPGRSHMSTVGANLKPIVGQCLVLDLPGLEEKEDVSDWYRGGGSTEDLFELLKETARPWSATMPGSYFGALRWEDLDKPGEELQSVIDGWWSLADLSVNAGPSKSGKSFLLIHAGMVTALQCTEYAALVPDFFGVPIVAPGLVVYFAGEGSRGVKNRLRAFRKHFKIPPAAHIPFVLLTKRLDLLRGGVGDKLSDTDKLIAECKAWQAYYELPLVMVIIDTLATASAGADENSAKDMTTIFSNCAKVKDETGAHVALVHHMNKQGGNVRGHSSIYANSDQVILVTKDQQTGIRTALLDKQKDDEDGKLVHFELKQIELGTSPKSGRPITSCVILDVGEKDKAKLRKKRGEFVPSDQERAFMESFFEVLKTKATRPPPEAHISANVQWVVAWPDVRDAFKRKLWTGETDEKRQDQRVRTAATRAGQSLLKFEIIGREANWIWWNGRPIRGIPESQPADELPLDTARLAPLSDDDVDAFLGTSKT